MIVKVALVGAAIVSPSPHEIQVYGETLTPYTRPVAPPTEHAHQLAPPLDPTYYLTLPTNPTYHLAPPPPPPLLPSSSSSFSSSSFFLLRLLLLFLFLLRLLLSRLPIGPSLLKWLPLCRFFLFPSRIPPGHVFSVVCVV